MKVLILTISTGQGHTASARAISEYLKSKGAECRILDQYKYISPALSDTVEKGYLLSTKYAPKTYAKFYRMLEKDEFKLGEDMIKMDLVLNKILTYKTIRYIDDFCPDVIICSHLFSAKSITAMKNRLSGIKTIGIITDFTVHPMWYETNLDYYVTPTHLLGNQMKKNGIPEEKILPFGIPIDAKFSKNTDKKTAREMLNIENKQTVMVMMGSMGFGNIAREIKTLDGLEDDFQIIAVCGKNERAYKRLLRTNFKHKVYPYEFVNNVEVMMDASDILVTKPGGLTVSEALSKAVPMLIESPIPGQEDRNKEFLLNNGLAMFITKTFPIDEAVYMFFNNEYLQKHMREGASYIGSANSSEKLGDFVLSIKKNFKD